MFPMHRDRSSSGSSTRSTSSSRSLSLSPGGWNPSKPLMSPATTTTTPFSTPPVPDVHAHRKLLASRLETFAPESAYNSYAYPCWPAGDSLSHTRNTSRHETGSSQIAQAYHGAYAPPSSRIDDEDLECLDFSRRAEEDRKAEFEGGISWSQVGTGAPVLAAPTQVERRKRCPPPGGLIMERRSSDRGQAKRRKALRPSH